PHRAAGCRFASAGLLSGLRARLETARVVAQPPFAGRHLRAGHPRRQGGRTLMQAYWTLVRRELGSFFVSWTGYIIIAGVVFLLGFSFASLLKILNAQPTPVPVTQLFYESYYFWLILPVVPPIITMRSFALEKSSGTYETL